MCAKLPTSTADCLSFFPSSQRVLKSCGASQRWVMKSAEREFTPGLPLGLMFCLILTCTRHLNSHWFGWKNIWNRAHQSKGTHTGAVKIPACAVCVTLLKAIGVIKGETLLFSFYSITLMMHFPPWGQRSTWTTTNLFLHRWPHHTSTVSTYLCAWIFRVLFFLHKIWISDLLVKSCVINHLQIQMLLQVPIKHSRFSSVFLFCFFF